jgi:hypothetical protein
MLINLKKRNEKIDILVTILLMVKASLNLMDFEELRFTQSNTQNMFFYGAASFGLLAY